MSHIRPQTHVWSEYFEHCDLKAYANSDLRKHQKACHEELEPRMSSFDCIRPFKCNECDYHSNKKSNLKNHASVHTDERPFPCSFEGCDYRGKTTLLQLKRHVQIHSWRRKSFSCPLCHKEYLTKHSLQRHNKLSYWTEFVSMLRRGGTGRSS